MLTLFGLCPAALDAHAAPRAASPRWIAAVALLSVAALLAVVHQSQRFAVVQRAHDTADEVPGPSQTPPPGPPPSVERLGPFAVHDAMTGDWAVAALTVSDRGVVVALSGSAGRAAFEMTCARSKDSSPFDLEAMHIFYSSDLPVAAFEVAGRAVRARVRRAAGSADPCVALARWRAEAAAPSPSGTP